MANLYISWNPVNVQSNISQKIEYKLHSSSTWLLSATVNSKVSNYIITGVLFDTEYDIRISGDCDGTYSSVFTAIGTKPVYEFISRRTNFSYPRTMVTGYRNGNCSFETKFIVNLDNSNTVSNSTVGTTQTVIGGNINMFSINQSGNYRLKALIQGNIVVNNSFEDSDQVQTTRFIISKNPGNVVTDLIALGQNSDVCRGVNAGQYCIPGQYVACKGTTVPVNINYEGVHALSVGDKISFNMTTALTTHNNQQQGANESNTTTYTFSVMQLEIKLI